MTRTGSGALRPRLDGLVELGLVTAKWTRFPGRGGGPARVYSLRPWTVALLEALQLHSEEAAVYREIVDDLAGLLEAVEQHGDEVAVYREALDELAGLLDAVRRGDEAEDAVYRKALKELARLPAEVLRQSGVKDANYREILDDLAWQLNALLDRNYREALDELARLLEEWPTLNSPKDLDKYSEAIDRVRQFAGSRLPAGDQETPPPPGTDGGGVQALGVVPVLMLAGGFGQHGMVAPAIGAIPQLIAAVGVVAAALVAWSRRAAWSGALLATAPKRGPPRAELESEPRRLVSFLRPRSLGRWLVRGTAFVVLTAGLLTVPELLFGGGAAAAGTLGDNAEALAGGRSVVAGWSPLSQLFYVVSWLAAWLSHPAFLAAAALITARAVGNQVRSRFHRAPAPASVETVVQGWFKRGPSHLGVVTASLVIGGTAQLGLAVWRLTDGDSRGALPTAVAVWATATAVVGLTVLRARSQNNRRQKSWQRQLASWAEIARAPATELDVTRLIAADLMLPGTEGRTAAQVLAEFVAGNRNAARETLQAAIQQGLDMLASKDVRLLVRETDGSGEVRYRPSELLAKLLEQAPAELIHALRHNPAEVIDRLSAEKLAERGIAEQVKAVFMVLRDGAANHQALRRGCGNRLPPVSRGRARELKDLVRPVREIAREIRIRERPGKATALRTAAITVFARFPAGGRRASERRFDADNPHLNLRLEELRESRWWASERALADGLLRGFSQRRLTAALTRATEGWAMSTAIAVGMQPAASSEASNVYATMPGTIGASVDMEPHEVTSIGGAITAFSAVLGLGVAALGDRLIRTMAPIVSAGVIGSLGMILLGHGQGALAFVAATIMISLWNLSPGLVRGRMEIHHPVTEALKDKRDSQVTTAFKLTQLAVLLLLLMGFTHLGTQATTVIAGLGSLGLTAVIWALLRGTHPDAQPRAPPKVRELVKLLFHRLVGTPHGVLRAVFSIPMFVVLTGFPFYALGGSMIETMVMLNTAAVTPAQVAGAVVAVQMTYRVLAIIAAGNWVKIKDLLGSPEAWRQPFGRPGEPRLVDEGRLLQVVTLLSGLMMVPAVWLVLGPGLGSVAAMLTVTAVFTIWFRLPLNRWMEGPSGATLIDTAKILAVGIGAYIGVQALGDFAADVQYAAAHGASHDAVRPLIQAGNLQIAALAVPVFIAIVALAWGIRRYHISPVSALESRLPSDTSPEIIRNLSNAGVLSIGAAKAVFQPGWTPRGNSRTRLQTELQQAVGLTVEQREELDDVLKQFPDPRGGGVLIAILVASGAAIGVLMTTSVTTLLHELSWSTTIQIAVVVAALLLATTKPVRVATRAMWRGTGHLIRWPFATRIRRVVFAIAIATLVAALLGLFVHNHHTRALAALSVVIAVRPVVSDLPGKGQRRDRKVLVRLNGGSGSAAYGTPGAERPNQDRARVGRLAGSHGAVPDKQESSLLFGVAGVMGGLVLIGAALTVGMGVWAVPNHMVDLMVFGGALVAVAMGAAVWGVARYSDWARVPPLTRRENREWERTQTQLDGLLHELPDRLSAPLVVPHDLLGLPAVESKRPGPQPKHAAVAWDGSRTQGTLPAGPLAILGVVSAAVGYSVWAVQNHRLDPMLFGGAAMAAGAVSVGWLVSRYSGWSRAPPVDGRALEELAAEEQRASTTLEAARALLAEARDLPSKSWHSEPHKVAKLLDDARLALDDAQAPDVGSLAELKLQLAELTVRLWKHLAAKANRISTLRLRIFQSRQRAALAELYAAITIAAGWIPEDLNLDIADHRRHIDQLLSVVNPIATRTSRAIRTGKAAARLGIRASRGTADLTQRLDRRLLRVLVTGVLTGFLLVWPLRGIAIAASGGWASSPDVWVTLAAGIVVAGVLAVRWYRGRQARSERPDRAETFASLRRESNFRRYFGGQAVGQVGTYMQASALDWLVFSHGGGFAVGVAVALQAAPTLLAMRFGSMADRSRDLRRILRITTTVAMLISLALGVLELTHKISLWWVVYPLCLLTGALWVMNQPAREVYVKQLVGVELRNNARSLIQMLRDVSFLVGTAAAGLLIAALGTGWVLLISAVTFLAPLIALHAINQDKLFDRERPESTPAGEALRYVRDRPVLAGLYVVTFLVLTVSFNFSVTLPLLARDTFGGGPAASYALFTTVMAVGGIVGAGWTARQKDRPRLRLVLRAALAFGLLQLLAGLMPTMAGTAVVLTYTGIAWGVFAIGSSNNVLQRVDAAMVGRFIALNLLVSQSGSLLGSPLVGWLGDQLGGRWPTVIAGSWAALVALIAMAVFTVLLRAPKHGPPPRRGQRTARWLRWAGNSGQGRAIAGSGAALGTADGSGPAVSDGGAGRTSPDGPHGSNSAPEFRAEQPADDAQPRAPPSGRQGRIALPRRLGRRR